MEADEVTYNLHILARFELEQALLAGDLPVGDVPGAWNEKYDRITWVLLPQTMPEDVCRTSIGVPAWLATFRRTLWATCTRPSLFAAAAAELGDLSAMFAEGDFVPLLQWLRQHVHGHGQRYRSAELVQVATGRATEP